MLLRDDRKKHNGMLLRDQRKKFFTKTFEIFKNFYKDQFGA